MRAFSLLAALVSLAPAAFGQTQDIPDLSGNWSGSMACNELIDGLSVDIKMDPSGNAAGTLRGYATSLSDPQTRPWSHKLKGEWVPDDQALYLAPDGWISGPTDYESDSLVLQVDDNGKILFGGHSNEICSGNTYLERTGDGAPRARSADYYIAQMRRVDELSLAPADIETRDTAGQGVPEEIRGSVNPAAE